MDFVSGYFGYLERRTQQVNSKPIWGEQSPLPVPEPDEVVAAVENNNVNNYRKLTVETSNNHIYFYSYVDSDRCLALIQQIRDLDNSLRNERLTRSIPDSVERTPIWLHINSMGGELLSAMAIADQLSSIDTPIYSIAEGLCASAATIISLSCDKKYITPMSFMLVHQFSSFMWGKHEEFKDEMKMQEMLMKTLVNFYCQKTSLEKKEVEEILKRDSWFSAEQCIEKGFVDGLI